MVGYLKVILEDYAGQHCDVVIVRRADGSKYVTFKSQDGYGYPSLELCDLKALLERIDTLT